MDFKVSSTTIEGAGVLLVSVEGELDIATAEQLAAPSEVAAALACPLILDLSSCPFVDSTGLRSLLHAQSALSGVGAPVAVVTDQAQPRGLLSLTGTDLRVPVFAALEEAIAWLGGEAKVSNAAEPSLTAPTNGRPASASRLP